MKPKIIIKTGLLLFVTLSVVFLIYKELKFKNVIEKTKISVSAANVKTQSNGVIAYYFHGNNRCYTCQLMESYAHEVISTNFKEEINKGNLIWAITNVETHENFHFIRDFQLTSISMVLARNKDGRTLDWKNLDQIWRLANNKEVFMSYINSEIKTFMEKN